MVPARTHATTWQEAMSAAVMVSLAPIWQQTTTPVRMWMSVLRTMEGAPTPVSTPSAASSASVLMVLCLGMITRPAKVTLYK